MYSDLLEEKFLQLHYSYTYLTLDLAKNRGVEQSKKPGEITWGQVFLSSEDAGKQCTCVTQRTESLT